MKINKVSIGQRIKDIRKAQGLTMEEFGNIVDNALKSNVSKWEKGSSVPNSARLKIIAELGNTTVDYLLYGSIDDYSKSLIHELEKELSEEDSISKGVIPFILREVESRISPKSLFGPNDINEMNRLFEDYKQSAIERWTNPENIETNILSLLEKNISNLIDETKKHLYLDYYKNDDLKINSADKVSEMSDIKMKFLDTLDNYQRAAFDSLRYNDKEKIQELIDDLETQIEKLPTFYL